jgi:hypothetical protein
MGLEGTEDDDEEFEEKNGKADCRTFGTIPEI